MSNNNASTHWQLAFTLDPPLYRLRQVSATQNNWAAQLFQSEESSSNDSAASTQQRPPLWLLLVVLLTILLFLTAFVAICLWVCRKSASDEEARENRRDDNEETTRLVEPTTDNEQQQQLALPGAQQRDVQTASDADVRAIDVPPKKADGRRQSSRSDMQEVDLEAPDV